ncbi:O-antigen polymerase [Pseudarthrobacter sp. TAF60_1]|uniref:O-antigen polymerase n=1 Tax=Pseudarthrobacter sp. TAF60_1 TaxID=3233071 RepID=UPI003F9E2610
MPWLNPVTALVVPWTTVMLIASIPGALNPSLTDELWAMVFVGFLASAAGSLIGWVVSSSRVTAMRPKPAVRTRRVLKMHLGLSAALGGYGVMQAIDAWPVLQRLGGVQAIFSSSAALGNEYKYQYAQDRLATTNAALDGSSFITGSLGYLLFLGHVSLFTGAILWKSGMRGIASIPLILAAAYSLFSLQRTSFFMCLLIFATTALYAKSITQRPIGTVSRLSSGGRNRGRLAALLIAGGVMIPVLLYPIQQRNNATHNSTGFESLAQYLISSLAGLNQRINTDFRIATPPAEISGAVAPSEGLGAYTFTGLYGLLKRSGLDVPVAPHSLDYYSSEIFGVPFATNTGTSYLDFYLDFGWPGVIFMPFLLGFIASVALRKFLSGSVAALPVLVILIVSIIWSFFVNALLGDFRYLYLTIIASVALPWILYGSKSQRIFSHQQELASFRR